MNRGDVWIEASLLDCWLCNISFRRLFVSITKITKGWSCCITTSKRCRINPVSQSGLEKEAQVLWSQFLFFFFVLQRCIEPKPSMRTPSSLRCSSSSLSTFTPLHFMLLSSKEGVAEFMQNTHTHAHTQRYRYRYKLNSLCHQVCGLPKQLWHTVWHEERRCESIIYLCMPKGNDIPRPSFEYCLWTFCCVLSMSAVGAFPLQCGPGGCLIELAQQLFIIMVGKQFINNVQEFVVPYVSPLSSIIWLWMLCCTGCFYATFWSYVEAWEPSQTLK